MPRECRLRMCEVRLLSLLLPPPEAAGGGSAVLSASAAASLGAVSSAAPALAGPAEALPRRDSRKFSRCPACRQIVGWMRMTRVSLCSSRRVARSAAVFHAASLASSVGLGGRAARDARWVWA